jgi:hypothetical protein
VYEVGELVHTPVVEEIVDPIVAVPLITGAVVLTGGDTLLLPTCSSVIDPAWATLLTE